MAPNEVSWPQAQARQVTEACEPFGRKQVLGAGGAQSVQLPTLDFGSGHDPRVMGSSPALGSALTVQSLLGMLSLSLSLSLSVPPLFTGTHALSLKINK